MINYKGDPLTDFSLMHFLDRFAFRNPKSKNKPKVEKVIKKKAYDPWGVRGMSIKSAVGLEILLIKKKEPSGLFFLVAFFLGQTYISFSLRKINFFKE